MSQDNENKAESAENSSTTEAGGSDQLKAELDKSKKDYLYLLAEFDNYRKNAIKERSDSYKYGSEKFLREFLNVYDNFERALETEVKNDNWTSFREGVQMIATELKSLLQKHGVDEVKSEGEPFDPSKHEALSGEPRADMPEGHVARVFKKAYKLHDKLIRPAQVTVATAAQEKN